MIVDVELIVGEGVFEFESKSSSLATYVEASCKTTSKDSEESADMAEGINGRRFQSKHAARGLSERNSSRYSQMAEE